MNHVFMGRVSLFAYRAVIFDLDGTLYYQKPFRKKMLLYLIKHFICHPSSVKDILIIKRYREVREKWESIERKAAENGLDLDSRQYTYVAKKMHTSPQRVQKAVQFFMLEAPLKLLPQFQDRLLAKTIDKLRKKGIFVAVYSDYPVTDKLKALGITVDRCFTSADKEIGCMKPDPKGLAVILKTLGVDRKDAIMVGDRLEKDGMSAQRNQVDYLIVSPSPKERQKLKDILDYSERDTEKR